jgi:hypothetical protein
LLCVGCVQNDNWYYTDEECTKTFYNGIMSHGLLGAFNEYLLLSHRAAVARRAQMAEYAAGATCVKDVNTPELQRIEDFTENYMAAGWERANEIRLEESTATIDQFQSLNIVVTAASVITLVGGWHSTIWGTV